MCECEKEPVRALTALPGSVAIDLKPRKTAASAFLSHERHYDFLDRLVSNVVGQSLGLNDYLQFSSGPIHYPRRITLLTNLARKSQFLSSPESCLLVYAVKLMAFGFLFIYEV